VYVLLTSSRRRLLIRWLTSVWLGVSVAGCARQIPEFDGTRAYRHLIRQTELGPRHPGSTGHDDARRLLVGELSQVAEVVQEQTFQYTDEDAGMTFDLTNIIASFLPDRRQRIMLGAHWDTRPRADRDPDPLVREQPILGANDGASGVAVLLEIARLLHEYPPPVGVDIILFDGEDYGQEGDIDRYILGSTHFAANMGAYRPRFGIVIDMIGDSDLAIYKEHYSVALCSPVVDLVWNTADRLGLEAFHPDVEYAVWDDHIPLLRAGIPCVLVIDFDYRYWHTLEDTPDKCSQESLAIVGELLTHVIYGQEAQGERNLP